MSTQSEAVAARITHPTKGVVRITPDKGYSIMLFDLGREPEVLIASDDGEESWRVRLVAPAPGEKIQIKSVGDSTEVRYVLE